MVCDARADPGSRRTQKGAVAIVVGLMLAVMLGVAAFAIDFGRWIVVDTELQNAADATALAGAGRLMPPVGGRPNWSRGLDGANAAVSMNRSDGAAIETGTMVLGYWDFSARTFDTNTAKVPTSNDLPAIRATIERRAGVNSGPVATTFGRLLGVASLDAEASAVAVISRPQAAGPGALAPIAVSSCLLTSADPPLWNAGSGAPVLRDGEPIKFVIASGAAGGNHCNGCGCGQWTTFDGQLSSVTAVRALIEDGNGSRLAVGDRTFIQPGVEASVYDNAAKEWPPGTSLVVPNVNGDDLGKKGFTPIVGWSCIVVHRVVKTAGTCETFDGQLTVGGRDDKGKGIDNTCMVVSFSRDPCPMAGAEGGAGGPFTGLYVPPRLVQ
jgi:Flp pilus assembly protein TadG